ncbi:hypothetical protein D3C75_612610 [compost metagenome]
MSQSTDLQNISAYEFRYSPQHQHALKLRYNIAALAIILPGLKAGRPLQPESGR